ncbi:hypothetical protein CYLTODRAFT_412723 [Cylindrobasidium torrendii FP15055 ss-10]|uniref:Uncharacterized protein n=1 Tax=Cylindrobasidium torrendii FP15055 ss-10 TaxID=1314674 RepID=A0A0D7B456_9AGAR|nr:hypothetical protein CYLTODRAFT_412723 [Cylindrobasidium torrendii FP15055 ss-10]
MRMIIYVLGVLPRCRQSLSDLREAPKQGASVLPSPLRKIWITERVAPQTVVILMQGPMNFQVTVYLCLPGRRAIAKILHATAHSHEDMIERHADTRKPQDIFVPIVRHKAMIGVGTYRKIGRQGQQVALPNRTAHNTVSVTASVMQYTSDTRKIRGDMTTAHSRLM